MDKKLGARSRFSIVYALIAFAALFAFQEYVMRGRGPEEVPYSQFRSERAHLPSSGTESPRQILWASRSEISVWRGIAWTWPV